MYSQGKPLSENKSEKKEKWIEKHFTCTVFLKMKGLSRYKGLWSFAVLLYSRGRTICKQLADTLGNTLGVALQRHLSFVGRTDLCPLCSHGRVLPLDVYIRCQVARTKMIECDLPQVTLCCSTSLRCQPAVTRWAICPLMESFLFWMQVKQAHSRK